MNEEFIKYVKKSAVAAYRLKNLHYDNHLFTDLGEVNFFWKINKNDDANIKLEYIRQKLEELSDEIYDILLDLSDGQDSYD